VGEHVSTTGPGRSTLTLLILLTGLAVSLLYHSPLHQDIQTVITNLINQEK
jgi:hypothetical protein